LLAPPAAGWRWIRAAVRAARPRQWPKNLLVLAAPLAGASVGRDDGIGYALVAIVAFTAASAAVYYVNDVLDAERDRGHPVKRHRPVASGDLPAGHALGLAAAAGLVALGAGLWIGEPGLTGIIAVYLAVSAGYSAGLKHVPVLEAGCVASGFVLRALAGAVATHVPPSGWFLLVCSLGALAVAAGKRRGELAALGPEAAARHRPVLRFYPARGLDAAMAVLMAGLVLSYLAWAAGDPDAWRRGWHLASAVPLAVALARFGWLAGRGGGRGVEELILSDRVMTVAELAWLALFAAGL
jgi:decaprenyl-phosphate phosphoribosyltransferase